MQSKCLAWWAALSPPLHSVDVPRLKGSLVMPGVICIVSAYMRAYFQDWCIELDRDVGLVLM